MPSVKRPGPLAVMSLAELKAWRAKVAEEARRYRAQSEEFREDAAEKATLLKKRMDERATELLACNDELRKRGKL